MIVNCIRIGADEGESPNWSRFQGLGPSAKSFLVCSLTLSFVSILELFSTSLSLIPKCLNDYKMI